MTEPCNGGFSPGLTDQKVQKEKGSDGEIHSFIPSCIKRKSTLDITTKGLLKAKRRTIIHTGLSSVYDDQDEEISSSFHIIVEKGTLSDFDTSSEEVDEASPALEDGVQAIINELKEINLSTIEEPYLTFISALLTFEEPEEYFKLLLEYKDVFS